MPTAATIVAQLAALANRMVPLALAWHVVLAGVLLTARRPRYLLAALAASVAACAALAGNPVNLIVFAGLALWLAADARRPLTPTAGRGTRALAALLIAFGWVYPHFLVGSPGLYLIAAPVGVVPCPTLAMLAGLALVYGVGRRTRVMLAIWCAAYAVLGVAWFGIWLDAGLALGAFVLLAARSAPNFR